MTNRKIVLGIDSSTQSCKVLRVDAETGEVLSKNSAHHPDGTSIAPQRWWEALERAGGTDLNGVDAVSVSAQQHGMVALDDSDDAVHDALLWNDVRSAAQAESLKNHFGVDFWANEIGVVPVSSFTVTKLAWLAEHHPDLAQRVRRVMLPHDLLSWQLGGKAHDPVTDRSDASGTGYYSVPESRYRNDILTHAFGRVPELPKVIGSSDVAGHAPTGALIGAGCGDNAGAALGLGLTPGEVVVSVGTSGTVFTSTALQVTDTSGAIAGFADATGNNLPLLATINGARILASTADLLGVNLSELDRLASVGPLDAGGLTLVPYFDGERTPNLPHATGSLVGMTRAELTRENMARSAVLGLLCVLADSLDSLRTSGIAVERVLLIGGGSMSQSLRVAAADVFQAEVVIPEAGEYVALGAARQAAWALSGDSAPPVWERRFEHAYQPSASGDWARTVRGRFADARSNIYGV